MLDTPRVETLGRAAAVPPATIQPAAFHSLATEIPPRRVSSAELAQSLGIAEEWILSRTGIRERPVAAPDDRLSDYAARAGARALARAGVEPGELDLVIVATMTQDELTPNTAPLVATLLGADRAGAFDVGAACTAFLSALSIGAAHIETGRATWVLVVGADFITRILDWTDHKSAPLFADGCGAAVLGPSEGGHGSIGPIVLGADGSQPEAIYAEHSDRKLRMDGQVVYRNAVNRMTEATLEAVARAGMALADIDLFVYHQANARITRAVGERLGLPPARVVDCIERLGNSSAATLPLALSEAERDGRLRPGARVLLAAFGAGFTWGGGVIEWGSGGE
ncbi:MAG TPA: beta-ketoacyl-ACP synthase 3 [Solirubrobacteraceae bacterium]|jgi:3-oxoacyl-[acyl-carrier-protein] synthase-3